MRKERDSERIEVKERGREKKEGLDMDRENVFGEREENRVVCEIKRECV